MILCFVCGGVPEMDWAHMSTGSSTAYRCPCWRTSLIMFLSGSQTWTFSTIPQSDDGAVRSRLCLMVSVDIHDDDVSSPHVWMVDSWRQGEEIPGGSVAGMFDVATAMEVLGS